MSSVRIGFIGSGRMATAIIRGWNASSAVPMSSIAVAAPSNRCTGPLKAEIPELTVAESNVDVVQRSTIVIIAVKPHILPVALQDVKRRITPAHLVVTIAAGVTTAQVEAILGKSVRVVRVVPNTPCAVQCNAGAVCRGHKASDADTKRVQKLFAPLSADRSEPDVLDEKLMDAVTGLAGSGPAFVFSFIESLADGGVYAGLPRHVAARLAAQTVMGAAKLVLESGEHPAALRDAVCSPGGTTIEGVRALEEGGMRAAVMGAVARAAAKGATLRAQAAAAAEEAEAAEPATAARSPAGAAPASSRSPSEPLPASGLSAGGLAPPGRPQAVLTPPPAALRPPSSLGWPGAVQQAPGLLAVPSSSPAAAVARGGPSSSSLQGTGASPPSHCSLPDAYSTQAASVSAAVTSTSVDPLAGLGMPIAVPSPAFQRDEAARNGDVAAMLAATLPGASVP